MNIDIDVAPPDGWEIYGYGAPQPGDMVHVVDCWCPADEDDCTYSPRFLLARKKPLLSVWANGQKDFQDLARMRSPWITRLSYHGGTTWLVDAGPGHDPTFAFHLPEPPSGIACLSVKLVNGRWEELSHG